MSMRMVVIVRMPVMVMVLRHPHGGVRRRVDGRDRVRLCQASLRGVRGPPCGWSGLRWIGAGVLDDVALNAFAAPRRRELRCRERRGPERFPTSSSASRCARSSASISA